MSLIFQKPPFNYQYKVGISNQVDYRLDPIVATGVVAGANLHDLIVPARALVQDGQKLFITAFGRATGAGNKRVFCQLQPGAIFIYDSGSLGINNQEWSIFIEAQRTSPQSLQIVGVGFFAYVSLPGTATAPQTRVGGGSVAVMNPLFDAPLTVQFRADVSTGGDTLTHHASYLSVQ